MTYDNSCKVTVTKTPSCWWRSRSRQQEQHVAAWRTLICCFCVLIILAQITLLYSMSSSTHISGHHTLLPQPRKLLLLHDANSAAHLSQSSKTHHQPVLNIDNEDLDTIYDEDKRKVHTGPNPLHN
ncbi:hypothetical protein QQ045_016929 [Rhodiola kirilowii]